MYLFLAVILEFGKVTVLYESLNVASFRENSSLHIFYGCFYCSHLLCFLSLNCNAMSYTLGLKEICKFWINMQMTYLHLWQKKNFFLNNGSGQPVAPMLVLLKKPHWNSGNPYTLSCGDTRKLCVVCANPTEIGMVAANGILWTEEQQLPKAPFQSPVTLLKLYLNTVVMSQKLLLILIVNILPWLTWV